MNFVLPIITSLLYSSFIYLEYFNISSQLLNTFCGLFGLYLLLTINKKQLFLSGFFISILWFWWIGYSFVHYDLSYLIPLVLLAIGMLYGTIFYLGAIFNNIYYRASYLFALTFIYPFGFNWLQMELPFINSYLGTSKLDFILILSAIIIIIKLDKLKRYIAIIPLLFTLNYNTIEIPNPPIKIKMANINVPQENKWNNQYLDTIIKQNLSEIDNAIAKSYDLIILPETTFPLALNLNKDLLSLLKYKSQYITIITGALHSEENIYHNSTYLFQNRKIQIAHKVVLIPFGEAVPLPEVLRDIINNTFYNGAKDYESAKDPTTFDIKGIKFRSAICYEATTSKIFDNLENTKYMIAISNNAWFIPSTQPTLQKLLLKYYSKKYNIKIFSTTNMSKNFIIF